MVRILASLAVALALTACQGSREQATVAAQNANPGAPAASAAAADASDGRIAKEVFGTLSTASVQASEAFGGYSRGCQAGAVQLPETGPTWQAMRLSRNRNWGQPILIDYIEDLSRAAATLPGWQGLYIGDMSQPRGGPMTSGHRSHQIGLDVDVWLRAPHRLDLPVDARESISSTSMMRQEGAFVNDQWTAGHMALLRAAASDPRVARIFLFPGAKVWMCENATGDRDWLRKIRPWWGHHYHFHVRLSCPPGMAGCVDQEPPPPGDGCAEAQEWVDRILNPPPPDPNAPPPAPPRELVMADLPAQCHDVARN